MLKKLAFGALAIVMGAGIGAPATAQEDGINALAFSNGTVLLGYSDEYGGRSSSQWIALALIDEDPTLGWASAQGAPKPHSFVFELNTVYSLHNFGFDSAQAEEGSYPGISAEEVRISVSTEGAEGPWAIAYEGTIDPGMASEIEIPEPVEARWVKLEITDNGGRDDYTELMEFSAFGLPMETPATPAEVSGTYDTNWGRFYVSYRDGALRGCYDHDEGKFAGSLVGNFLNIEWRETGDQHGKAVIAITADGRFLNGFWYENGARQGTWFGPLMEPGSEPECAADLIEPTKTALEQSLEETGRATLYGIYFDLDSDVLRAESEPTLNEVLAYLNNNPGKGALFEGHTDSLGAEDYNLDLSARRAAAVVKWLTDRGVDAGRLSANGLGEGQPVADNDNPSGRALNRRVEVSLQ